MTHIFKSAIFLLVLSTTILLSGCSNTPSNNSPVIIKEDSKQRMSKLAQLKQWKLQGKIAFFKSDSRDSFSLLWQVDEHKNTQQLNLTSFLGINVLQLDSSNNNHKIQVDGETYRGHDLEALINSLTGLTLPTQALSFWLKGLPYQESDLITYQKTTQLPKTLSSHYNNEAWLVSYNDYQQIDNYTLATKLSIKKDDLLIKIAINEWSVN